MEQSIQFHPNVTRAIAEHQALVALESTVITHGLPYPTNAEAATTMENAVRKSGATPAIIAIIQGRIYAGLSSGQLEYLSKQSAGSVRKCSRRDLAIALARGEDGGTTVAGTMILAEMAGIELFATGGIGGVHRGHPFDVSADLTELGRTPVTVVCSGAKSILDLPATLEMLETLSVPVVGYQTSLFPAFYARSSGLPLTTQAEDAEEVAILAKAHWEMGVDTAVLLTVPAPINVALPDKIMADAVNQALKDAAEHNIKGGEVTPFLLKRVSEITGKASLNANLGLLLNNARVAARVAVALNKSGI